MLPTFNSRGDLLFQEYPSVYLQRIRVGACPASVQPLATAAAEISFAGMSFVNSTSSLC